MNELVVIEKKNALDVFSDPNAIEPLLAKIEKEANAMVVVDLSSDKSRKQIASAAYKVAQTKTYIDNIGKDLVADLKELPKRIDATRKIARDRMDALRDSIRKPLDEWEAEQARIAAEEKAAAEAAELALKIEQDFEMAVLMNREFERQAEDRLKALEQERIDRERMIAENAARAAKEDAEKQIAAAKMEAKLAERRAKEAVEVERKRVEEIAKREAEEIAARAADKENRKKINSAVVDCLVAHAGLEETG